MCQRIIYICLRRTQMHTSTPFAFLSYTVYYIYIRHICIVPSYNTYILVNHAWEAAVMASTNLRIWSVLPESHKKEQVASRPPGVKDCQSHSPPGWCHRCQSRDITVLLLSQIICPPWHKRSTPFPTPLTLSV